ncbi:MAG: chromosome segregation protein SMC [Saprospiraceae bacterium]|nr:chromosome segregation protein SMC [Saprospiraceae bacterium]
MKLKSLEINGFKSFANHTIINFNEAITGIVGPNGSGKSNVVDAIRWVLGEQKGRELRLEAMSDVIFNGTKKRKVAPLAQVSLSFENTRNVIPTDYQNVTISRLLYRSGESEYRLNNVPCRLKDITGLFLDTGIGSDSYAIIALNMVEDLLSNKENARRKMFEQAAGISKYKTRKRESINKLKSTNEDLSRIEDLLFEINNNLNELEKQAKRAKKYYEMRDKFRSAGLLLAHISINNLKSAEAELETKITSEQIALQELEIKLLSQEAELEKFKKDHLDHEKNLSDYQKNVNVLLDTIRNYETEIQIKQQKVSLFESQAAQLKESSKSYELKISNFDEELKNIESEIKSLQAEVENAENNFNTHHSNLKRIQEEYDAIKAESDIKIKERQDLDKLIFDKEKESAILSNQIDNLDAENNRANDEILSKSKEFENAQDQIGEYQNIIDQVQTELAKLSSLEDERRSAILIQQNKIDKQLGIVNSIHRAKDAKQNELELLRSMIERMEGFPESMQYLNSNWRKNVPVLSDIIVVQDQYKSAIELSLEPYLNFFLVENEDDAIQAIKLLKKDAKGKANFFLLNKLKNSPQSSFVPNNTFKAIDVVECDSLYKPLLTHLLNNIFIANDNIEELGPVGEEVTIVNASGNYLKQSNAISGGSSGLFEGKRLGRKKNFEKLELDLKDLSLNLSEADSSLGSYRQELKLLEEKSYAKETNELRIKESHARQKFTEISTKYNSFIEVKAQIETRIAYNQDQILKCKSEIETLSFDLVKYKLALEDIISVIGNSDSNVNYTSAELSSKSALANQANLELLKTRNKFDNILKDKEYRISQRNELMVEIDISNLKLSELEDGIASLDLVIKESVSKLELAYSDRKDLQNNLSILEQEYYEIRNYISLSEQSIKDSQRHTFESRSTINTLKEKKNETLYRVDSIRERAELEFGTKFENFEPDQETLNLDELQLAERVNYYKVRLDNYGEVNPLAMEAYDEMKERYDVIQVQREDILKAKESLLETIKEIEEKATSSFMDSFNKVRGHFQTVFRSLFTEDDDCDLILLDEMDPLECDIDIVAKPKGKKPKSISQLSGGEKTLTAIALLFSLYLLKPAPFCIFDEVDAPLDDVNIEKFNRIVRKFSTDSQFIIITHNKLTMAEVDVLYGVYMEEQGVSGVTAVDFRKYDYDNILTEMQG